MPDPFTLSIRIIQTFSTVVRDVPTMGRRAFADLLESEAPSMQIDETSCIKLGVLSHDAASKPILWSMDNPYSEATLWAKVGDLDAAEPPRMRVVKSHVSSPAVEARKAALSIADFGVSSVSGPVEFQSGRIIAAHAHFSEKASV